MHEEFAKSSNGNRKEEIQSLLNTTKLSAQFIGKQAGGMKFRQRHCSSRHHQGRRFILVDWSCSLFRRGAGSQIGRKTLLFIQPY